MTNDSTASPADSPSQAGFRRSLLRAWWPAAAWIVLIGFESTDFFSSENTGTALYTILSRLFGHIDIGEFFVFHHILRKTGHVVGYGTLSLLLLRGWRATFGYRPGLLLRAALLSWLGTAFVAAMDEWHQSYIPSRTGTIWDVALDTVAGVAFLVVAYFWLRRTSDGAAAARGSA
ncbi:MAG TPA: VanZ family protein [Terriglobales bacterium]|nr:VanZ family protein [Terriglobales bacterium]